MSRTMLAATALLATALATGAAEARSGGGSSFGDSYYNDMQRNPRLIEPGGESTRYLSYYGSRGYDDRRAAQAYRYGYGPYGVRVRPYGY